jgi:hypothetical protein
MSGKNRERDAIVCNYLVKLFSKPPLTGTILALDETGVGRTHG